MLWPSRFSWRKSLDGTQRYTGMGRAGQQKYRKTGHFSDAVL
jgi:hypothetical protein